MELWRTKLRRWAKWTETVLPKITGQNSSRARSQTLTSQSIDFLRPHVLRPNRTKTLISSGATHIPPRIPTKWALPPNAEHPMSPSSLSGAASTLSHGEADTTLETTLKTLSCNVDYKHRKQQLAGFAGNVYLPVRVLELCVCV